MTSMVKGGGDKCRGIEAENGGGIVKGKVDHWKGRGEG